MSQIDDYNNELPRMQALAAKDVQVPTIPIDVAAQEAEDLYIIATKYREQLTAIGITDEKITRLHTEVGALREAQSRWKATYNTQQGDIKSWDEQSPEGYALQRELNQSFRYAYRKDKRIMGRVREIADGSGDDDMIQDLNDYAVLGKENPTQLTAINFDATKLDRSAELSDTLGTLLAQANGDKKAEHELKDLRDRAYTLLKEDVTELRDAGKYAFADQPDIAKLFTSEYSRRHRTKKDEPTVEE